MYEPEPDLEAGWSEAEQTDERTSWRRARTPERRQRDLGRNARRNNGQPDRERAKAGAPEPGDPPPSVNVVERIQLFNKNREPERLQLKYARMRSNPYCFYRGTPHLF